MKRPLGDFSQSISDYFANLDKGILLISLLLASFGIAAVSTATAAGGNQKHEVTVQLLGVAVGLLAVLIFSKIDYSFLGHFSVPIVLICSVVLLLTAFVGVYEGGNTNWLDLGFVSVQPSEFAKIAFILTFSTHVSRVSDSLNRIPTLCFLVLHFLAYFIPICIQGDFGTGLVYCGMFLVILYMAGLQYRYFIIAGVVIVAAFPILWNFILKDYHKKRILFSLNPELDPLDFGYQPILSKIAIGSGGLTGLGYGEGVQSQNELLPASHTDFIYSVIGEEFGFIGCIFVLVLITLLVVFLARGAKRAKDDAGKLICFGLAAMFAVQTIMNVGMCIGVSPVIGVTLPFISSGGSSVLASFCAIGLAESVRMKPDHSLRFGNRRRRSM
ncbi:MAG: rod shape-determining protein RodA [Clostridia bacterium]|nr:rod shape-determining protein RodA [Clostridia bacterium]